MSDVVRDVNLTTKNGKSIYGEGTAVLADDEGGRTDILYVEEAKDGKYKLRQNETKGVDVLNSEFSEAELSEPP